MEERNFHRREDRYYNNGIYEKSDSLCRCVQPVFIPWESENRPCPADGTGHDRNRDSIWCQRRQRAGAEIQGCAEAPVCHDRRQDNILRHGTR